MLSELDFTEQTEASPRPAAGRAARPDAHRHGGLFSSISLRRGFAMVGTIGAMLLGYGVVTAIQGISEEQDESGVGEVAGLFPPYSSTPATAPSPMPPAITPPTGAAMTAAYFVVLLWSRRGLASAAALPTAGGR